MSWEITFVFALIGIASILFASGRVRLDIVALLVVLALALSGVLTVREALAGFGDPVVILVAGLLVLGEALTRTGVAYSIGQWVTRVGGDGETRLIVLLMIVAGVLGSVMSSTAIVAVFIPVVLNIASKTNLNPSRLLIPMSYAALISGMLTLIATTPNLVVSEELSNAGYKSFSFFSFTPIGLGVLIAAVAFMALIGRHLLPGERVVAPQNQARGFRDLMAEYGVDSLARQFRVPSSSPLAGKSLTQAELGTRFGTWVALVERQEGRGGVVTPAPGREFEIHPGDLIALMASDDAAHRLASELGIEPVAIEDAHLDRWARDVGLATVLIHPESGITGRTVREAELRSRYGTLVLGVRHKGEVLGDFLNHPLESGDAMLVLGSWQHIGDLQTQTHDFVVLTLPIEMEQVAPARKRAPVALAILAGMVLLSALEIVPVVVAVLIAALATVFTRCLTMDDAYRAIHWSSLVLIAGMLPIAGALKKTGGVDLLVEGLNTSMGDYGPYAMMTALFFISAGLGLFLSNTATAVLMAPVAIGAAQAMGVSPYAFAMTVAIAASAAFATPVSTPVVTLVVEPGHYRFMDFVKVGSPMVLITWIVTMFVTPLVFPY
ncbi:MAG: SLC13 family permease [Gammaproteobacteria bacterium]|nr:MAG: SLC13 family permease [Gammaproteobacteria bacterium]